jgi:hypothetical protein
VLAEEQQGFDVNAGLGMVTLIKTTTCDGHDPRLFVGEVDLILVPGTGFGRLGTFPARFPAGFLLFGLALDELLLVFGLLPGVTFGGPGLNLGLGPGDGGQAFFAARQFSGKVQPVRWLAFVRLFRLTQQLGYLGLDSGFELVGVFQLKAWCLEALALILVPSRLTLPSFRQPICWAISRICTNSGASCGRNRLQKVAIVS